jgi:hypothetical protein
VLGALLEESLVEAEAFPARAPIVPAPSPVAASGV